MSKDELNIPKMRSVFESFNCKGVLALIDFLESEQGKGLILIGSSSIAPPNFKQDIFLSEEDKQRSFMLRSRSLHIGSSDGSITPLQWLFMLSKNFEGVSPKAREFFDKVCANFAKISACRGKPIESIDRDLKQTSLDEFVKNGLRPN